MATSLYPLWLRARVTGRPWWSLLYFGGTTIDEPDCDWLNAPHRGRQALRLYCPDGNSVTFEAQGDGTGRFFQFKSAVVLAGPAGRSTLAHVVGMVVDTEGRCVVGAWDCQTRSILRFEDNVFCMKFGNIGRLSADHLGLDTR